MKAAPRSYDTAMSEDLRAAVRERRRFPDGRTLAIRISMRGDTEIYTYPWSEMKLGDFFFVPLRGQRPGPLSIRFRQVAARKDWELTIVQCLHGTEPSLRVCLTLLDVSELKKKAQQYHGVRGISYGDGRWTQTRKARYRRAKGTPKLKVIAEKVEEPVVTQSQQSPVEMDATLSPGYDREKVIRERLAAMGIGAKA